MSRDNPRSDRWREYYDLHPNILASYGEAVGNEPPHEPGCESPDPYAFCWCSAFCGFCNHHADHHTYRTGAREVPCTKCPDGVCPYGTLRRDPEGNDLR